ncbi:hypothetical protein GGD67_003617 [Bradyrhizobium sp. IAR9]|uniref:hypothetical protein n=1 Tax=Bradyrhizobium sp. IAR9 TaxID=2663841 RepID=UPI0015CB158C|nr:hypothetical protein [Bradyrhizobium sp. IAR9]NYG46146.1 hypothetical protein [Bradyrhizobium sp. IAR9]
MGGAIASALALPAIAGTVIGAGIAIGGSFHVSAARTVNFQFKEFDNVGSNLIVASDGAHLVSDALVWNTADQTITAICNRAILLPQFRAAATVRAEAFVVFQAVGLALSTMTAGGFAEFKQTVGPTLMELNDRMDAMGAASPFDVSVAGISEQHGPSGFRITYWRPVASTWSHGEHLSFRAALVRAPAIPRRTSKRYDRHWPPHRQNLRDTPSPCWKLSVISPGETTLPQAASARGSFIGGMKMWLGPPPDERGWIAFQPSTGKVRWKIDGKWLP